MKAIVQNAYGGSEVLSVAEVETPVPKDDEVLVEVYASSVNAGDYFTMNGHPYLVRFMVGFPRPKQHILGWDVAGKVVEVGENVSRLKKGDVVYGAVEKAFSEYVAASENMFSLKPKNCSFEEAAAVPTVCVTALQGLRDIGNIKKDQMVLVNGASGGVGSSVVQIAKHYGANVTGVCSGKSKKMVESIGADKVIDYTKEDFTKGSERYDLIFDNVGNHSFRTLGSVLSSNGIIIPNTGHAGMGYVIKSFMLRPFSSKITKMYLANPDFKELDFISGLIDQVKLRPVIDKTYPFQKIPEAVEYIGKGHAHGKVVITIKDEQDRKK